MRRLWALLLAGATFLLLTGASSVQPSPSPSPSSAPEAARGVSLTPDPKSPRRSKSGTFLEFGSVALGVAVLDVVVLRSTFETDQDIGLYAADAMPAVGGGFGFGARTDPPKQVGAWLKVSPPVVRVPAGGQVRARLRLVVPKGAQGGEYVGAVIAEAVDQGPTTGVQTRTRFAMAVYLRVPGAAKGATPGRGRPDGRLQVLGVDPRFDGSKACPTVRYRNDSQDIVDPRAEIRAEGLLGAANRVTRQRTGALLPGAQAEVTLACITRPIGPGKLTVTLSSPKGNGALAIDYRWLPLPVLFALLFLLLVIGALLTTFIRGLRRRRERAETADSA